MKIDLGASKHIAIADVREQQLVDGHWRDVTVALRIDFAGMILYPGGNTGCVEVGKAEAKAISAGLCAAADSISPRR